MNQLLCLLSLWLFSNLNAQILNGSFDIQKSTTERLSIDIIDITPGFLQFYDSAIIEKADPQRRWQLWQELYGFAAVPPGEEGQKMARTLLDSAWLKYPKFIERISKGASVLQPSPLFILRDVVTLLNIDTAKHPIKIIITVFVGGFEKNAFAYSRNGVPAIAIPVEMDDKDLHLTMAHEIVHAVHTITANLSKSWERSIAQTVLMEGLAMKATEKLIPGLKHEVYLHAHSDTWLSEADKHQIDILKGIQNHLNDSSSEVTSKFLFGNGTTGTMREAYYAGWIIVGYLEKQGKTLANLVKLPQDSIAGVINNAINDIIQGKQTDKSFKYPKGK